MNEEVKNDSSPKNPELTAVDQLALLKLMENNLAQSEEILKTVRYIKKYIFWQQTWSILRLFIIVIPIIFGFIYLPPLIKDALESYKSLLQ